MTTLALIVGVALMLTVLWDTFETMILPRTVTRRVRLTRYYYRVAGGIWAAVVRRIPKCGLRDTLLNAYGPLSLLFLIVFWALLLILSFGLIQWGYGSRFNGAEAQLSLGADLYFSGVTFLTLGFGDVTPRTGLARTLAVLEAGVGFGFLAIVISYLPILYQSFSRREINISLLDARAGSPPTASELFRRHAAQGNMMALVTLLKEWERTAAELLESYLSYPILSYYRSQHDHESWLGALAAILDTCALASLEFEGAPEWQKPLRWQAHLTFAMARHALVDLALILVNPPTPPDPDRLPTEEWERLRACLAEVGIPLRDVPDAEARLAALRRQYEPYLDSLGRRLFLEVPPWIPKEGATDNWQNSAWDNGHF